LPLIVGLDLGTTNVKAIAVDENGKVIASAARGYPIFTPLPGRAEQDPQAVWRGAVEALHELSEQLAGREIIGLSLSGACTAVC
jgi:sugar (pentulose or hexulose) kinase